MHLFYSHQNLVGLLLYPPNFDDLRCSTDKKCICNEMPSQEIHTLSSWVILYRQSFFWCFPVNYLAVNLLLFYQFPDCLKNNPLYWHLLYCFDLIKWNYIAKNNNKQFAFKQLTKTRQKSNWRTKKTYLLRKLKTLFSFIHKIFSTTLCFAW